MGSLKDWQRMEKEIREAQPKPAQVMPYLEQNKLGDDFVLPQDIVDLPFPVLAKELGALKSKCLKVDGTRKLAAQKPDLERLKLLWCRWQRELKSHL